MIEYQQALDLVKEVQLASDVQHVFIAFMDEAGNYRSIRSSELGASSVKPFNKELKGDPIHHLGVNMEEVTSGGSTPSGRIWEDVMKKVLVIDPVKQNENIMVTLSHANKAAMDLVKQGFTILAVKLGGSKPVIRIQNDGKCNTLQGMKACTGQGRFGKEIKTVALFGDVQIEWLVRGN